VPAMQRRILSFVLLLVFCCSLAAGHLPCRTGKPVEEARGLEESGKTLMSCHGSKAAADASVRRDEAPAGDEAGGEDCCSKDHDVCVHACHMLADVPGGAPVLTVEASIHLPAVGAERSLPRPALPIDHIPLA